MHATLRKSSLIAEQIGQVVRQERERSALRQDELALVAGVSTRVVHQIEHGKPTSRLDSIVSVLDALGLQLIVEGPSSPRPSSSGGKQ